MNVDQKLVLWMGILTLFILVHRMRCRFSVGTILPLIQASRKVDFGMVKTTVFLLKTPWF